MGKGLAVKSLSDFVVCVMVTALLAGCGNDRGEPSPIGAVVGGIAKSALGRVTGRRTPQAQPAATGELTRADIEHYGIPLLRLVIKTRASDVLVTIRETKGTVVTWATTDGTTVALKDGLLIQTRGLGPDLMSAAVPTVADLSSDGVSHPRSYFFLGEDDRSLRRDYTCTVTVVGKETIKIFEKSHETQHVAEECVRAEGKITNDFWIEGEVIRKSRQWTSPGIGYMEFEKAVD